MAAAAGFTSADRNGRGAVGVGPVRSIDVPNAVITARDLRKEFGDFVAVDGIDFDVAPGESFGFLGPNGAGKTSTTVSYTHLRAHETS